MMYHCYGYISLACIPLTPMWPCSPLYPGRPYNYIEINVLLCTINSSSHKNVHGYIIGIN